MFHQFLLGHLGMCAEREESPQQMSAMELWTSVRIRFGEARRVMFINLPTCFAGLLASLANLAAQFLGTSC